ncbi:hypothetical protein LSH36_198g01016 [Paralvinella palmiformis]|uniref:G-protein coupled receptors family 1 profile domain-containing protein n=1 Tax=Paralvinella palmiformis TaxID=53620 RepID=A0AAD9JQ33_9ANNE|nr:hypothetical protein LSH36_198g01016 [Paralvinella palmiformis]
MNNVTPSAIMDPTWRTADVTWSANSGPDPDPTSSGGGGLSYNGTEPPGNWTNGTSGDPERYAVWQASLIVLSCSLIIFGTILGNVLVCIAVAIVRKLRTPSNLLIVSLAVSDLLVAILVMPFAVTYEVMGMWQLGQTFCDAWTSLDVMLCTASILNLCMISIDRYSVITRPLQYAIKRTPKRMAMMIGAVWITSAVITIPPLFGWQSEPEVGQCSVSQEIGYQFYATIGAFYIPLTVMIIIYYRIYMVSSRIARAEAKSMPVTCLGHAAPLPSGSTTPIRKDSPGGIGGGTCGLVVAPPAAAYTEREENHNLPNGSARTAGATADDSLLQMIPKADGGGGRPDEHKLFGGLFRKSKAAAPAKPIPAAPNRTSFSKERKATKTLGVIMGAFTACWLPFFMVALIRPYHPDAIPQWLHSLFLWLGYANSFLNPVIYARFNREFRTPFKEILLFRCMDIDHRLRMEMYTEQYGPRRSIRNSRDTVVHYHSQGQTFVKLGNGQSGAQLEGAALQL